MTDTLAIQSDPVPDLGARWIKANLIAALVNGAVALGAHTLGNALVAGILELGSAELIVVSAATALVVALGYVLLGVLTANVLAQKLPQLRKARWIAFFALFGLAMGIAVAVMLRSPQTPPPGPEQWDFLPFAAAGAAILFGIVGIALGGVQALVLRHAASGLTSWVWFTALSCTVWVAPVLVEIYSPFTGHSREIVFQTAVLITTLISSLIVLPALHRLRPR